LNFRCGACHIAPSTSNAFAKGSLTNAVRLGDLVAEFIAAMGAAGYAAGEESLAAAQGFCNLHCVLHL
jgi:hypothetical protein